MYIISGLFLAARPTLREDRVSDDMLSADRIILIHFHDRLAGMVNGVGHERSPLGMLRIVEGTAGLWFIEPGPEPLEFDPPLEEHDRL